MFRIVVSLREKRSTTSQFENVTVGVDLEANNLEITSPEEIVAKTRQMFQMARAATQAELLQAIPERASQSGHRGNGASHGTAQGPSNGHANGHNGNGHNGNGGAAHNGNGQNGASRSYGRPQPEPSAKQRILLQKIARERNLTPEYVGDVSRRELGKNVPQLDRHEMSRLLEMLMEQEARS